MPRPDGKLYPSEVDALKRQEEAAKAAKAQPAPSPAGMARAKEVVAPVKRKRGRPAVLRDRLDQVVAALSPRPVGGQSLKATPELIQAILGSIEEGLTIDKSCILHGISPRALDKWKAANENVSQLFRQAEVRHELKLVRLVEAAAPKDWKAGNWLLERRHAWIPPQDRNNVATALAGGIIAMHKSLVDKVAEAKKVDAISVKATAA